MPGWTSYRGLQVPDDTPSGAAGAALKDDLKSLVDWSPKSNYPATTNPTVDDDVTADYYRGSVWLKMSGHGESVGTRRRRMSSRRSRAGNAVE